MSSENIHVQSCRSQEEERRKDITQRCEYRVAKDTHEAKYSVVVKLLEPITARYVRFIPTTALRLKVMRAELYGCMAEPMPPYGGRSTL